MSVLGSFKLNLKDGKMSEELPWGYFPLRRSDKRKFSADNQAVEEISVTNLRLSPDRIIGMTRDQMKSNHRCRVKATKFISLSNVNHQYILFGMFSPTTDNVVRGDLLRIYRGDDGNCR